MKDRKDLAMHKMCIRDRLQPAERIADRGFAPQRAQLATQNDICALAVDV